MVGKFKDFKIAFNTKIEKVFMIKQELIHKQTDLRRNNKISIKSVIYPL